MTIPDAARPSPIKGVDAKVALVDPSSGKPSIHGLGQQESLRQYVNGAGRIIPCSASGTNVITLTPNDASPLLEKYVFGDVFLFWAANASTGAVAATVVPKNGTLDTLKVYMSATAAQAGSGSITANALYMAFYVPTLDSNAGGFVLQAAGTGGSIASAAVTSQATLDIPLSSAFDVYEIDLINMVPATDAVAPFIRFSQSSSYLSGGSDYAWAAGETFVDEADSEIQLSGAVGNQPAEGISVTLRLFRPGASSFYKTVSWFGWGRTAAPVSFGVAGAGRLIANTDPIDGIRLLFSSGNIASGYYVVRAF